MGAQICIGERVHSVKNLITRSEYYSEIDIKPATSQDSTQVDIPVFSTAKTNLTKFSRMYRNWRGGFVYRVIDDGNSSVILRSALCNVPTTATEKFSLNATNTPMHFVSTVINPVIEYKQPYYSPIRKQTFETNLSLYPFNTRVDYLTQQTDVRKFTLYASVDKDFAFGALVGCPISFLV